MFMIKTNNDFPGADIYDISHTVLDIPDKNLYYKHMHQYCELLLLVRGDVEFTIGGDQYHLQPYDLLLIPQGTYHYLSLRSAAVYENYVIYFYDTLLPLEKTEKLFQPPTVFNIQSDYELLHFFSLLDTYHSLYSAADFRYCAACLLREILIYCCYTSRLPASSAEKRNVLIQNALKYIDTHLEEALNVDTLAEYLKMSRSHIQNVFSQHMQIGLKQYIMQKKIMAAHHDLVKGMSAQEASVKYHFNDYSTFYRLYRKTFGICPSACCTSVTKNESST